jgi:hypothetical protein
MDYQNCFATQGGKRVINDLKEFVRWDTSVIPMDNNGRTDEYMVMRNEGKRSVIYHIERMLKKKPHEEKQEKARSEK